MSKGISLGAESDALPSDLFGYEVLELLGEGVGSRVYRVQGKDGKPLALKHVQIPDEPAQRFYEQLKNEHERSSGPMPGALRRSLALKTRRAYLVGPVQEAGLVVELFAGSSLELRKWPGEAAILDIFMQVAQGVRMLHRTGYLHADLRPSNILVNDRGQVKVIDFGHSCKLGTVRPWGRDLPDYQSPEQLEGEPLTFRTDVFSFGWVLYWGLCRRNIPMVPKKPERSEKPIKKGHEPEVKERQNFPAPHEISSRIPEGLSRLIMRCLDLDPKARPAGMDEIIGVMEDSKEAMAEPERVLSRTR